MWMGSFPTTGDPPVVQSPADATTLASFVAMLDQKFVSENVTRCYKEDLWNCKQGTTENICNFIACFDCLRMFNLTAGLQAVAMFEHAVQAPIVATAQQLRRAKVKINGNVLPRIGDMVLAVKSCHVIFQ